MKDIGLLLRTKLFERLNNAITLSGNTISVYDIVSVPADATKPYILLGNFTSTEIGEGSKQSYGQEAYFDIHVVTKFGNAFGGRKEGDYIANEISQLVRTRQAGYLDLTPDWICIGVVLDNTTNIQGLESDGMLSERIMRFKFNVYEN